MRPIIPFPRRLSQMTGISQEDIQCVLETPIGSIEDATCWQWHGHCTRMSLLPIMHYHGKPVSVRRAIREEMTGTPVPASIRLHQICPTPLCVHPSHAVDHTVLVLAEPDNGTPATDSVEDCAHAIYSRDPPWSAEQLAEEFDYPLELVQEALRLIEAGEM